MRGFRIFGHQGMRHQVINARIKPDLIDQRDACVLGFLIQRPHLGRDIGGGHKMRAIVDGELCQFHMPITGQHRDHHVSGAEELRQTRDGKLVDVGGEVTNGLGGFFRCAVPDGHVVTRFEQATQAGDGGEASAAPVNSHSCSPSSGQAG